MDLLKEKLKEDEAAGTDQDNQEGADTNDDEQELIRELNDLREFVNNNKECIEDFFNINRNAQPKPDDED